MSLTLSVRVPLNAKNAVNITVRLPTGTPASDMPDLVAAQLYQDVGPVWRSAHVTNMGSSNFVLTRFMDAHFTEFPAQAQAET